MSLHTARPLPRAIAIDNMLVETCLSFPYSYSYSHS